MRALAIVGSVARAGERAELPHSDRVALALALARFGGAARACALDAFARGYARAAGFGEVSADLDAELGAAEVVLVGRGACGERGDAFPAQLAERLGAALAYEVVDARPDALALAVERDLGRGARDRLAIAGRAVLAVAE
ncbi:MAG TPA: hypothetical protein VEC18_00265, partial [Myxococcota bacterium]|nr:hypothetical protein [Myxococcota bacterium]